MDMATLISSDLRRRRTVRVWFFRDSGLYMIGLAQGNEPISTLMGTNNPDIAEEKADRLAFFYGVDVSSVDVGELQSV